jgi:hypothetical protein
VPWFGVAALAVLASAVTAFVMVALARPGAGRRASAVEGPAAVATEEVSRTGLAPTR